MKSKKRVLAFLSIIPLLLSLTACSFGGIKTKKAFETSKEAYNCIETAYEITNEMDSDIYEAWRAGIYDKSDIESGGVSSLARKLNLSESDLKKGLTKAILGDDYENHTTEDVQYIEDNLDVLLKVCDDKLGMSLFSLCVNGVVEAYKLNGKADEAQKNLENAKGLMKTLSNDYSDYEHYPALKDFYTTTSSYYDFCVNPTGSFEQLKSTLEDYRNKERDYKSDLDYVFED